MFRNIPEGEARDIPFSQIENEETWAKHKRNFSEQKPGLIVAASLARNLGTSHRRPPFLVGCSIMAARPENAEECHLEFGWNFTPLPAEQRGGRKSTEKMCAERAALNKILENRDLRIIGIITVSREIRTGDPSKAHDALHPCRECRDFYRDLLAKGILRRDSTICSVNDSKLIAGKYPEEEMTVEELLMLYHDD